MEIVFELPPNYHQISKIVDLSGRKPIFCYGEKIYNPHKIHIDQHLILHEGVHSIQQLEEAPSIEEWWEQYLLDPAWRVTQEVEAYRIQYKSFCTTTKNREIRHKYLFMISGQLSSPMYGNAISQPEAMKLLKM